MTLNRFAFLFFPTAALACGDSNSPAGDQFTVQTTGEEVVLSNPAGKPAFYYIVERETATVLDFATCIGGPRCKNVAPGTTARIPYRQIVGYKPDRKEAIVYWWRSVMAPTGARVDEVRHQVVQL